MKVKFSQVIFILLPSLTLYIKKTEEDIGRLHPGCVILHRHCTLCNSEQKEILEILNTHFIFKEWNITFIKRRKR